MEPINAGLNAGLIDYKNNTKCPISQKFIPLDSLQHFDRNSGSQF